MSQKDSWWDDWGWWVCGILFVGGTIVAFPMAGYLRGYWSIEDIILSFLWKMLAAVLLTGLVVSFIFIIAITLYWRFLNGGAFVAQLDNLKPRARVLAIAVTVFVGSLTIIYVTDSKVASSMRDADLMVPIVGAIIFMWTLARVAVEIANSGARGICLREGHEPGDPHQYMETITEGDGGPGGYEVGYVIVPCRRCGKWLDNHNE